MQSSAQRCKSFKIPLVTTILLQTTVAAHIKAFCKQALGNFNSQVQIYNLPGRMMYRVWLLLSSQQPVVLCFVFSAKTLLTHEYFGYYWTCLHSIRLTFFPTPPCLPFPSASRGWEGTPSAPADQRGIPQHMINSAKNSSRRKRKMFIVVFLSSH